MFFDKSYKYQIVDIIALQNGLWEQQTLHTIQIVIHFVLISNTNSKSFKVSFKTQPIILGYY